MRAADIARKWRARSSGALGPDDERELARDIETAAGDDLGIAVRALEVIADPDAVRNRVGLARSALKRMGRLR